MSIRLHWSPDSANLVVRIALNLLELPYESVRVNRGKGDHKKSDYLALNPQGLLPVLEDGDLVLFETAAILWHLIDRTGRLGPNGPEAVDPHARANALRWMFYLSNTLHADLRAAFYTDRYVADPQHVPSVRRGLRRRIHEHCDMLETQLDGGLVGQDLTIPDVYLCVCLRWAQIYPPGQVMLDQLAPWPGLKAMAARVEAHPAAEAAFGPSTFPAAP